MGKSVLCRCKKFKYILFCKCKCAWIISWNLINPNKFFFSDRLIFISISQAQLVLRLNKISYDV